MLKYQLKHISLSLDHVLDTAEHNCLDLTQSTELVDEQCNLSSRISHSHHKVEEKKNIHLGS